MSIHWLVVAAFDRARIFTADAEWRTLVRIDELVHPEARLKAAEILTHPHGHGPYALPPHGAPPPVPGTDPIESQHQAFAESVAQRLHEGRAQGQYTRFILAAPAAFLAQVDAHLDPETAHRRVLSVAHGWGHLPDEAIEAELARELSAT